MVDGWQTDQSPSLVIFDGLQEGMTVLFRLSWITFSKPFIGRGAVIAVELKA
jgi:hypothetical protein